MVNFTHLRSTGKLGDLGHNRTLRRLQGQAELEQYELYIRHLQARAPKSACSDVWEVVRFLKSYDLELLGGEGASLDEQQLETGFKRSLAILQSYGVLQGPTISPSISELKRHIRLALKKELGVEEGMTGLVYKRVVRLLKGISSHTYMAFLRVIYGLQGELDVFMVYKGWRSNLRGLVDEVDYL